MPVGVFSGRFTTCAYIACLDYMQYNHVRKVLALSRRYSTHASAMYYWSCHVRRVHKSLKNDGGLSHCSTRVKTSMWMDVFWSGFVALAHTKIYRWTRVVQLAKFLLASRKEFYSQQRQQFFIPFLGPSSFLKKSVPDHHSQGLKRSKRYAIYLTIVSRLEMPWTLHSFIVRFYYM
jgi:hypothetical protein